MKTVSKKTDNKQLLHQEKEEDKERHNLLLNKNDTNDTSLRKKIIDIKEYIIGRSLI